MTIHPVVLAGGRGTRLWPMSRSDRPKQFLALHGERSLFQKTLERHTGIAGIATPLVVCGVADRFQVADGIAAIGMTGVTVVLEPAPRNTGPAIAAAAEVLVRRDPGAIMLVLPSDHLITPDAAYFATLDAALAAAAAGRMVAFGVVPTHPETGYGYIKAAADGAAVRPVERFVEKPPTAEAARMVAAGTYFWNAGFFAFAARALLDELALTAPDVATAAKAAVDGAARAAVGGAAKATIGDAAGVGAAAEVAAGSATASGGGATEPADARAATTAGGGTIRLADAPYAAAPDISIDYALFERTAKASVAPISCRWSDVGSWHAFWETEGKDAGGNAIRGKGIAVDTKNSLIVSEERDVVALGLDGMAVVAVADAVLVCPLDRAQDVRRVVATLKARGRDDLLDVSPTVTRPWGGYTAIMNGARFQVKHLFVAPGKQLSLQKHYHRAEHWVVVRGTAQVTIDEVVHTLAENQSIYLPLGCVHRLANPGRIMLEVIEVQTGSYLGEDDIVRISDDWGRSSKD